MKTVLEYLVNHRVFFTFLLVDAGMYPGERKIKEVGLSAATVLFLAITVSAYGVHLGIPTDADKGGTTISQEVDISGLATFTFTIGNSLSRSLFQSLKHAIQPTAAMVGIFIVAAACTFLVGRYVFATDPGIIAGTSVGGITNTPVLAAAGKASEQESLITVGYVVSYLFGVSGMITAAQLALRRVPGDIDTPDPVTHYNVRAERDNRPTIEQIEAEPSDSIEISRMRRGEEESIWTPDNDEVLEKDDPMTVVSTIENVSDVLEYLGYKSSHSLRSNRRTLGFRCITVSRHSHAGRTVVELDKELEGRWGAKISRVRRGNTNMFAMPNFMIELGDRVHTVGPALELEEISKWLGDSSKGLNDINPVMLGLDLALGYFIGEIEFPIPGGGHFALGYATGALIVGLTMGKVGRIGLFITVLPSTSSAIPAELRLLMFPARTGTNAGIQILEAFSGGHWWKTFILGFTTMMVVAALLYIAMRGVSRMSGTKLSDLLRGAQTQPAVLASTNGRTGTGPRVALGYAFVYPVAMIVKVLLAYIPGTL